MPSKQKTMVRTKVATRTKIVVGVAAAFALGLAAYGFGVMPSLNNKFLPKTPISVSKTPSLAKPAGVVVGGSTVTAGTLTIGSTVVSAPRTNIIVPDGSTWVTIAEYRADAGNEDVIIDRVRIDGTVVLRPGQSLGQLGIWSSGAMIGSVTPGAPEGDHLSTDVVLSMPLRVPAHGSRAFNLVLRPDSVIAPSTLPPVGGVTVPTAIHGNIGLAHGYTSGSWEPGYGGSVLNVHATGATSGGAVYATMRSDSSALGGMFTIKKAKPVLTPQAVSTNLLGSQRELYRVNVSSVGPMVALKKMTFDLTAPLATRSASSTLRLSNFRVMKGSMFMLTSDVRVTNALGNDVVVTAPYRGKIMVTFTHEQIIVGSEQYSLVADITGSVAGDSVIISFFVPSGDAPELYGYLTSASGTRPMDIRGGEVLAGPAIGTALPATDAETVPGTFVWSDMSEIFHSDAPGIAGGSADWSGRAGIQSFDRMVSLTR